LTSFDKDCPRVDICPTSLASRWSRWPAVYNWDWRLLYPLLSKWLNDNGKGKVRSHGQLVG
jgi:hypothetical protein